MHNHRLLYVSVVLGFIAFAGVIAISIKQPFHNDPVITPVEPVEDVQNDEPVITFLPGAEPFTDLSQSVSGKKTGNGKYEIAYNDHTITISIGPERDSFSEVAGLPVQEWPVTFSDEAGNTRSFTRTFVENGRRIMPTDLAIYLDARTYEYVSSDVTGDPLRPLMEYSGPGLYLWIYEGLYYYNPATGKFGLDFDMIP